MEDLVYFILLALLAEILGTVGGFGSSMFFVPIAGYFFDFQSVLGITALFHVSSNLTKIFFFRNGIDKKLILSMGIPAVLFVVLGALLSRYVNIRILEILLAGFLISMSIILWLFRKRELKPTMVNSVGGGVVSGFVAGLLGTGGAIRGVTMAAFNLKTEVFIATSAVIDLAIDLSRSVVYTAQGYVHRDVLYLIPILLLASIAGTWAGKRILTRMSQEQFRGVVLILILITGLVTLGKILWWGGTA